VRLARRVAEDGRPFGGDGGGEGILGGGDARLIEEDVRAAQTAGAENERLLEAEAGPELLQREDVRVDAPTTDDVTARRREPELASAREERSGEEDRRADLPTERGIELGGPDRRRVNG
jgi:hypothetical protein